MYYGKVVTATKDTAESAAETSWLVASAGILHHVIIGIPKGHHYEAHLAFDIGKHQILPESPDMAFQGNGTTINLTERILLTKATNRIKLRYWNEDTRNDHTFYVLVGVLSKDYLGLGLDIKKLVDGIDQLLQRIGG